MSQIEQNFRLLLSKRPEIEKCYQEGLINRRALARYLIQQKLAQKGQLEALIAMLRRFEFARMEEKSIDLFRDIRIALKDGILILDFEKDKDLLKRLEKIIAQTDYDKGDTLKIVVGSSSITVFIDRKKEANLKPIIEIFKMKNRYDNISEISLMFPEEAIESKGVLSFVTRELHLNDIVIAEMLTASRELLVYVREEHVLKAYEVLKRLQAGV